MNWLTYGHQGLPGTSFPNPILQATFHAIAEIIITIQEDEFMIKHDLSYSFFQVPITLQL
jgi:hypothetical protein